MAIYSYCRVSTQSQAEKNSTQMQEVAIANYCTANNIVLEGSFNDIGISGTKIDRDGLIDLLNVLNEGDKVLVLNTSRLWRDDMTRIMIQKEIQDKKADVIAIEQPTFSVYVANPQEYLINSIMAILDSYDRMTIALKLAKGRRAKASKGGKPCGSMPYGYIWRDNQVEIDYNNHIVIKEIFTQYEYYLNHATVQNPIGRVVDYCKSKGYKTHRGNDFSKQAISLIVHNDFYIGVVTYNGKKIIGTHTPIIDRELFKDINADYDFSIFDE